MSALLASLNNEDWRAMIEQAVKPSQLESLTRFIHAQQAEHSVYPPQSQWFAALNAVQPKGVRVVILGQDPYHGPNQAHGLSFSVPDGVKTPPSLKNMFKELEADLGVINQTGNLTRWAEQGVLLLNAVLTVNAGLAGSHAKQGWEALTDGLIKAVSDQQSHVVFLLWGNYALKKRALINEHKHTILTAAHPSPLSAYRGWFGCGHFSKTNDALARHAQPAIDWSLS